MENNQNSQHQDQNLRSKTNVLDFSPRGYLIRYPLLVDASTKRFIDDFQDDFKQLKNGVFKLKIQLSQKSLRELLSRYIDETISSLLSKARQGPRPLQNDWIIISDSGSFRRASFQMLENDIDIGLKRIENIFNSLFNGFMRQRQQNQRLIYCKHRLLTSTDWAKICEKRIFGKKNFTNLSENQNPICVKEDLTKEISELSKKENSLIVKECSTWILEQMRVVNRT